MKKLAELILCIVCISHLVSKISDITIPLAIPVPWPSQNQIPWTFPVSDWKLLNNGNLSMQTFPTFRNHFRLHSFFTPCLLIKTLSRSRILLTSPGRFNRWLVRFFRLCLGPKEEIFGLIFLQLKFAKRTLQKFYVLQIGVL